MPKIIFSKERTIDLSETLEQTLLQASLESGIPHMCACGGNAKCSTCRVFVEAGAEGLSEPTAAEWKLASRKGFGDGIRLACQAKVLGDVTVRRLVTDDADAEIAIAEDSRGHASSPGATGTGREMPVAALFTDVRDFTPFVDNNLPYDVIHLLDRFFRLAGDAVVGHGGFIDKYMGDGMMALFGLGGDSPDDVCLAAVGAGLEIVRRVEELDAYTQKHFGTTFKVGVGIHYGPALVGTYGHPSKMAFSAIGDSINLAARVEQATRNLTCTGLLISDVVFDHVEDDVHIAKVVKVPLKGKKGDHVLYQVDRLLERSFAELSPQERAWLVRRAVSKVVSRRTAPLFLRLSYHDCITFDPTTGEGGADGSIRFPGELSRPESRGLAPALELLAPAKQAIPEVSWADLIAIAGAVAVQHAGGPEIAVGLGRKDTDAAIRPGLMPSPEWGAERTKAYFAHLGFDARLWTALSGAHMLGRVKGKTFTEDPYKFDNSYYRLLAMSTTSGCAEHMLKTDAALMDDEECARWVQAYATDQAAFFKDFGEAYQKMICLGFAAAANGTAAAV